MSKTHCAAARIWAFCGVLAIAGCETNGLEPPPGELNFPGPIALVDLTDDSIDEPTHLLVANTNFDLKYNGATLQAFNLEIANEAMDTTCGQLADPSRCAIVPHEAASATEVDPGALRVEPIQNMITSEVIIGSFANSIELSPDGRVAYLPVRSDANLTHVELGEEGYLSCGGSVNRHRCDATHRFVDDSAVADREVDFPNEPVDVVSGDLTEFGRPADEGRYLMLLHRGGAMSFLTHSTPGSAAQVVDVLDGLGASFVTSTRDPSTGLFYAASGNATAIARVGVALDGASTSPAVAQLFAATSLKLSGLNVANPNIRQIIADPRTVAPFKGRLYAVATSPQALLVGHAGERSELALEQVIDLGDQPTRATLIEIGGRVVIVVSCYGSRDLYFIDADLLRVIAVIRGFSGPNEIAFDSAKERLYVSDYRVSVLRFVDLKNLFDCVLDRVPPSPTRSCTPRLIGMLGIPNAVQQL